jgi:PKD repeat protein
MGTNKEGETMKKAIYFLLFMALRYAATAQIPTPTWHPVGPLLFPVNGSGQINGIGRVTKVKYDPQNPHKIYATSASGGLWISRNDGTNWSKTGTDVMPYHKEATLCLDYKDSNVIYLGTGDPNYYSAGIGVWKSTDGGVTFTQSNTGMGNRLVDELLMLPANDSILIAVTDKGIYKSYTAGTTWVRKRSSGKFTDMDFKPGSNGRVIYACTVDSMYRSDDAGETWNVVTAGFYIPGGAGGNGLRTAVTPADTNIVYLAMVANRGSIFKSTDGGHSFTIVKDSFALSLTGYSTTDAGQGDYNFDFNVDPIDPNTVYLVSHCTWRSTMGGIPSSWQLLTNWYEIVHTDMHQLSFDPYDPTRMINANDGGVWLSVDSGAGWAPLSDGLDATEIAPEASSLLDLNTVSIGTQDNGELYYNLSWITNRGGDWYEYMAYDYNDPQTVYYGNGNRRIVSQGDQSLNLPLVNDFDRIVFSNTDANVAFVGKDTILRTNTLSNQAPNWQILSIFPGNVQAMALSPADSNKLFVITDDDTLHISTNASAASPTFTSYPTPQATDNNAGILVIDDQPNVVYMYNDGYIFTSQDTGMTWTQINFNYSNTMNIVGMVHDKYTIDQSVFIANSDNVYYKNSSMSTWQNYSNNLPTVAQIQGLDMFNNGAPYSALRVPYYGRGLWEAPINTTKTVAVNFVSDVQTVCAGNTVHFTDSSYNNPTFWNWSFPGGTPSSSTLQNPVVSYNASGTYPVTLTAGNGIGNNSKTKIAYISANTIVTLPVPVVEGFEGAVFPPANWINYDGGDDSIVWELAAGYGGYGASNNSMFFDNYSYNESGKTKSMRFGTDLAHYDSVMLSFDVAYQTLQGYSDSLEVAISTDCGQTFHRVYVKGGNTLATAPHLDSPEAVFFPTATQWRTDSVNLYAYSNQAGVVVSFNNISGYGTYLYVDNINLHASVSTLGIQPSLISQNAQLSIYPNPTKGILNIAWNNIQNDKVTITVTDVLGAKVKETNIDVPDPDHGQSSIDISALNAGIYYVKAEGNVTVVAKVVLIK